VETSRERWPHASAAVNSLLLRGVPGDEAMSFIVEQVRELSTSDDVVIMLIADEEQLVVRAVAGAHGERLIGMSVAVTEASIAGVVANGTARLIPDGFGFGGAEYGSALAVPIGPVNRVGGVLLALRGKGSARFTVEQVPVLASFADQAALALELADKQRVQRRLEVLADRERVAGDLHDHVIQRLFATGMTLHGGIRRITDPEAQRRVLAAIEQLDGTVQEIRAAM